MLEETPFLTFKRGVVRTWHPFTQDASVETDLCSDVSIVKGNLKTFMKVLALENITSEILQVECSKILKYEVWSQNWMGV